ncbi:MAG: hypothetical protein WAK86_19280 [Pseudonocardiaceae bacterium]
MATQPQGTGAALLVANRAHWTFPDEEAEGANPGSTEPASRVIFSRRKRGTVIEYANIKPDRPVTSDPARTR